MSADPNATPTIPASPAQMPRNLIVACVLNLLLAALYLVVMNDVLKTNDNDVFITWATMEACFVVAPFYVFMMAKKGRDDFFITVVAWVPVAMGFYRLFLG